MSHNVSVEQIFSFIWYLSWADLQATLFEEEMSREVDADDPEALKEHQWRWFGLMSYWYASLNVVIEAWDALTFSDPVLDRLLATANMRHLLQRYRNAVLHFQCPITTTKFLELLREGEAQVFWTQALHQEFVRFLCDFLSGWTITSEQSAELRRMVQGTFHWYPYRHHRSLDAYERSLTQARQILSHYPDDSEARRALANAVAEAEKLQLLACPQHGFEEIRNEILRKAGVE